ncbi:type II toxin-antitoxin system Phd/YefM family antitoxin [Microbacterium sp.]|uniref:type II toxin-antitoxin system Phd/YefM family antitoxin n=1 Tax=Microbacterium sp. TaxID=51671 RepID=UPI0039E2AB10
MTTWQVQTAKQRFSEVLRAAQSGEAQFITKHGEPVAVIVDIAEYRRTHREPASLAEYLLTAPKVDIDLDIPPRVVDEASERRIDDLVRMWTEDE